MTTAELVRVDQSSITTIDEIVDACGVIRAAQEKGVMAAFRMASGIGKLRAMITDEMMTEIMALQGSPLGFVTDKDKDCRDKEGNKGYPPEIVKDCFIEALLRGARPIGNEFNIIASRCYLTKNYFQRTLADFPGLTDLVVEKGVPVLAGGNGLVPVKATWIYNGNRMSINCDVVHDSSGKVIADNRIPVRVNNGMIVDAILGKADRKIRAMIMERITNTTFSDGEAGDIIDVIAAEQSNNGGLKDRMRSSLPGPATQSEQPVTNSETGEVFHGPKPGEDVKDYYSRAKRMIETAQTSEELGSIDSALDAANESGFLNNPRHKDLSGKVQARVKEISNS